MSSTRAGSRVSSRPTVVSTTTNSRALPTRGSGRVPAARLRLTALAGMAVLLGACSGLHGSPLAPPPYQGEGAARYDAAWSALVRGLARGNGPIRGIARDSGVIA